jgi:Yip1-like protein
MSTAAAPLPGDAALSEPARIANTFIAPSKTFLDLRRNSSWWAPWLLISVVALGFVYTVQVKVGFDQVVHNEIAKNARSEAQLGRLPADQRAERMRGITKFTEAVAYCSPVTGLIAFVVIAAALMATFNFGAGASIPFKTSLAVVTYGNLPTIVYSLLGILSLAAGVNPEGFNIKNPVATNPAYFMDPTGNPFLYGMASALDVFVLWSLVLMAIGYSSVSKLKRSTTFAVVIGWYLVWKLVTSGAAVLFS